MKRPLTDDGGEDEHAQHGGGERGENEALVVPKGGRIGGAERRRVVAVDRVETGRAVDALVRPVEPVVGQLVGAGRAVVARAAATDAVTPHFRRRGHPSYDAHTFIRE